jgi:WD40 repeat protein
MEGGARAFSRGISHETHAEVRIPGDGSFPCSPLSIIHRVTSSIFSADARFVLTGSDDGNVRIWKAKASDKLGIITARERAAMEYRDSLKERWKMDAQVGKVARSVFIIIYAFRLTGT